MVNSKDCRRLRRGQIFIKLDPNTQKAIEAKNKIIANYLSLFLVQLLQQFWRKKNSFKFFFCSMFLNKVRDSLFEDHFFKYQQAEKQWDSQILNSNTEICHKILSFRKISQLYRILHISFHSHSSPFGTTTSTIVMNSLIRS